MSDKLTKEVEELRAWKESAMAVEREWDAQAIAKLLNIPLGTSVRAGIEPAVRALISQVERLSTQPANTSADLLKRVRKYVDDARDCATMNNDRKEWAKADQLLKEIDAARKSEARA